MPRPAALVTAAVGRTVRLAEVDPDAVGAAASRLRLAELGLRTGALVTVLARTTGGGRLLGVGTSRIAVDRATLRILRVAAP